MKNSLLHKEFRWNGKQFDAAEDLLRYARAEHPDAASFLSDWFSEEGNIQVLTSGSTGSPKVIQLQREQMVHSAKATGAFFGLGSGTRALHCLPVRYIAGKMMLVRAMVLGWQLYSVEPSSKLDLPEEIVFDFAAMVPLQAFHNLDRLGSLRKLLLGGGELPEELESSLHNLPTEVYMGYGMTETITHIAVRPVNPAAGAKGNDAYRALPGVTLSIDARGCLVVDAPGVSKIPVQTNDLVDLVSEKEFHWLGRFDNVINSGGIKLIPEEIEKQLKPFISHRFFVTSEKHDTLGEVLVLVIEGPHYPELLANIRQARISGKTELPAYAIPKKVYYSKKFKETETGKVQRNSTLASLRS